MQTIDLIIIFGYLIGITAFGIWFSGKQETTEDYFVGDRSDRDVDRGDGDEHDPFIRLRFLSSRKALKIAVIK